MKAPEEHDVKFNRRDYTKPELCRIKLTREMAVLQSCKDLVVSPSEIFSCSNGSCVEQTVS